MRWKVLVVIAALCFVGSASAQIDPSSALLLNNDSINTPHNALDTGRYTIRPKTDPSPTPRPLAKRQNKAADDTAPVTVAVPAQQPTPQASLPNQSHENSLSGEQPVLPAFVYVPAAQQRSDATNGPKDFGRRFNILEINVAPGYLYNNSDSIYTYRNYSTASPTASIDGTVWFNQNLGFRGSYLTTINDSVSDSLNNTRNEPVTQDWFSMGLRGRKFFGSDGLSSSLSLGIDYVDYNFHVASNAGMREALESSGLQLTLDAEVPVSQAKSWLLGVSFAPILTHSENATGISFQSGASISAAAVGVNVGQRLQLSRIDAIFWKLSYSIEKDLFTGTANLADPLTGTAPSGVSVTNSFGLIQIGYAWGD